MNFAKSTWAHLILCYWFFFFQQRHRSDSQVNNRVSYVVRNGQLVEEKWMNVKVGDVIRMENNHFVAVSNY